MADYEAKLVLTAQDNVSSAIRKISDALGKTGLGQAVTAASTSFLALKEAAGMVSGAISAVEQQFQRAIDAASEMETTNRKLALSLINAGEYTKQSFNAIVEWSDSVEAAIGLSNEAALNLVILGKNMGMTAEQATIASQAALDMGAALGMNAETAMRQLSMSMQGMAGRLGRLIPEVNGLTETELRSGAVIDIVSKKYAGLSVGLAGTYSGAQAKLKAQLDNVYEAFGRAIVQNPLVIGAMNKVAEVFGSVAKAIDEASTWIIDHSDQIQTFLIVLGSMLSVMAAWLIATNIQTVATTALTAATIVYNTVSKLTPWGLAIAGAAALAAGITWLIENFELASGVIKVGFGYALQILTFNLRLLLTTVGTVVGIFNKDWGDAIKGAATAIDQFNEGLKESGRQQMAAADAANEAGENQKTAADVAGNAIAGLGKRAEASEQALVRLKAQYGKTLSEAKDVFDKVKDMVPTIHLEQMKRDTEAWKATLRKLGEESKAIADSMDIRIGISSPTAMKELADLQQRQIDAKKALQAVELKIASETRSAILQEFDTGLQMQKLQAISAQQEMMLKQVDFAQQLRAQQLQIETERLLQERGLQEASARAGLSVHEQAIQQANSTELEAYKAHLQNQLAIAVDIETQKQLALVEIKKTALSGLGGGVGAGAEADATIAKEAERQAQLESLRQQGLIGEQQYQDALTQSILNQTNARISIEIALQQQRIEMLGIGPDGMAARMEAEQLEHEQRLEQIRAYYEGKVGLEDEFRAATEEAEEAHKERMNQVQDEILAAQSQRAQRNNDDWQASLVQIEQAQRKHGAVMGAIIGVSQTQQFQATQKALGDLSSLRNSKSKEAFQVGQKAAIAEATINTFLSATKAYSSLAGIPIVGPVLGAAAAAAAIAAGVVNIQNIASQKFGGQAHGGIDEIPASFSDKTFLMKGGEGVLQPEANKDLRQAADKINKGESKQAVNNFYMTFNGNPDESMVDRMKESIIEVLRSESEKGSPIIHEKGIVKAA